MMQRSFCAGPRPCAPHSQSLLRTTWRPAALPLPRASSSSSSSSNEARRNSSSRTRASANDGESTNPFLASPSTPSTSSQTRPAPSTPSPSTPTSTSPRPAAAKLPSDDARVESLEASIRGGKRGGTGQRRSIPIRGVDPPPKPVSDEFAPWKEGQLLPDGWEKMSSAEKTRELYMGQRGVLFWLNKLAYGAGISILVGWVFFRLVGPNLGLYQLAGDMAPTSL